MVLKMSEGEETVRLDRCPEYRDPRALLEIGIAGIVRVSQCGDPVVAKKAAQWLAEYAERLLNSERQGKAEEASGDSPSGSPPSRVC
jgi:hypothetical protein